jgi:hypothetical protein
MKQYTEGETKAERKARKNTNKGCRPLGESITSVSVPAELPINPSGATRYVVCLKYGNKYSADYVNKLYNMVKRNLTLDHEFVCFTEDAIGIDPAIRIEPIPLISGVTGWWYKPMFFNPRLSLQGTLLFFDLDVVIFRNIDYLFTYKPGEFCIIRDFNRFVIKNYDKFNSSIFRLETTQYMHSNVYEHFMANPSGPVSRYHGDQDWIRFCVKKDYNYWPIEWIQSYKWEMRGKPKYDKQPRGHRDFETNGNPMILDDTSVAVFHGDPNPHNCKDQWVIDNWT